MAEATRPQRCAAIEDIAAVGFDPARYGLTRGEVTASLHGILPDGHVVRGLEAIRKAYQAVGLGWLVAPTRLPIVHGALNVMYGRLRPKPHSAGTAFRPNVRQRHLCENAVRAAIENSEP